MPRRGVVLLAGDGHVRRDIGVPRWLSPATRARSVSIGLLEDGRSSRETRPFDLALATPAQPQRRPVRCDAARRVGAARLGPPPLGSPPEATEQKNTGSSTWIARLATHSFVLAA